MTSMNTLRQHADALLNTLDLDACRAKLAAFDEAVTAGDVAAAEAVLEELGGSVVESTEPADNGDRVSEDDLSEKHDEGYTHALLFSDGRDVVYGKVQEDIENAISLLSETEGESVEGVVVRLDHLFGDDETLQEIARAVAQVVRIRDAAYHDEEDDAVEERVSSRPMKGDTFEIKKDTSRHGDMSHAISLQQGKTPTLKGKKALLPVGKYTIVASTTVTTKVKNAKGADFQVKAADLHAAFSESVALDAEQIVELFDSCPSAAVLTLRAEFEVTDAVVEALTQLHANGTLSTATAYAIITSAPEDLDEIVANPKKAKMPVYKGRDGAIKDTHGQGKGKAKFSEEDRREDREPVESVDAFQELFEAGSDAHYAITSDGLLAIDTAALNSVQKLFGVSIDHIGLGDFYTTKPVQIPGIGSVVLEFDRIDQTEGGAALRKSGFSGRPHRVGAKGKGYDFDMKTAAPLAKMMKAAGAKLVKIKESIDGGSVDEGKGEDSWDIWRHWTVDERIVFSATVELKSGYGGNPNYRFDQAHRATGITQAQWDAAKASLVERDVFNKGGAVKPLFKRKFYLARKVDRGVRDYPSVSQRHPRSSFESIDETAVPVFGISSLRPNSDAEALIKDVTRQVSGDTQGLMFQAGFGVTIGVGSVTFYFATDPAATPNTNVAFMNDKLNTRIWVGDFSPEGEAITVNQGSGKRLEFDNKFRATASSFTRIQTPKWRDRKGPLAQVTKHVVTHLKRLATAAKSAKESFEGDDIGDLIIDEALPSWPGADGVYTRLLKVLDLMAKGGGATPPKVVGKGKRQKIKVSGHVSDDMRDLIDALDKGDQEELKAMLPIMRHRFPAAFKRTEDLDEGKIMPSQLRAVVPFVKTAGDRGITAAEVFKALKKKPGHAGVTPAWVEERLREGVRLGWLETTGSGAATRYLVDVTGPLESTSELEDVTVDIGDLNVAEEVGCGSDTPLRMENGKAILSLEPALAARLRTELAC